MNTPNQRQIERAREVVREAVDAANVSVELGQVSGNQTVYQLFQLDIVSRLAQALEQERLEAIEEAAKVAEIEQVPERDNAPKSLLEELSSGNLVDAVIGTVVATKKSIAQAIRNLKTLKA